MIEKIRAFVEKHWDMVSYLFFGVLTTIVNYLVYLPLYNLLGISAAVSNIIAWVAAVAFAYVTNKPFVFKSHDWSMKTVLPELGKFVGCRAASGGECWTFCFPCRSRRADKGHEICHGYHPFGPGAVSRDGGFYPVFKRFG